MQARTYRTLRHLRGALVQQPQAVLGPLVPHALPPDGALSDRCCAHTLHLDSTSGDRTDLTRVNHLPPFHKSGQGGLNSWGRGVYPWSSENAYGVAVVFLKLGTREAARADVLKHKGALLDDDAAAERGESGVRDLGMRVNRA